MALSPQPPAPTRGFSFTDWQVAHPTEPPPGDHLDGEFDRTNTAVDGVIDWVGSSLNTDGSLRAGTVGQSQMVSGLFNDIAQDIIDEVQPLVIQAGASAGQAMASASVAATQRNAAESANTGAQGAKAGAETAKNLAILAQLDAQSSAATAETVAMDAANAANHAAGDAALAQDWGIVSAAWAEHMPDTIPPNILAVMGVTGDHWSSRWWANKAAGAFGALSSLYLGAHPTPPTSTPTGDPIPVGAIYYNTTTQQPYVWTGTDWAVFYQPAEAISSTLYYSATAGQTNFPFSVPDLAGNTYTISTVHPEPVDVHVDGLARRPASAGGTWAMNNPASTLVFTPGLTAGQIVQIDILTNPNDLAPVTIRSATQAIYDFNLNPATGTPGQIDGTRTSFPLTLAVPPHDVITTATSQEVLISVDGIVQQPGKDYVAAGGVVTFNEAPQVGALTWGYYYGPSAIIDPNALPDPIPGNHTFAGDVTVMGNFAFTHSKSTGQILLEDASSTRYVLINEVDGKNYLGGDWVLQGTLKNDIGDEFLPGGATMKVAEIAFTDPGDYFVAVPGTEHVTIIYVAAAAEPAGTTNYSIELYNGNPGSGGGLIYQATGITDPEYMDRASFYAPTYNNEIWLRITLVDPVPITSGNLSLAFMKLKPA